MNETKENKTYVVIDVDSGDSDVFEGPKSYSRAVQWAEDKMTSYGGTLEGVRMFEVSKELKPKVSFE